MLIKLSSWSKNWLHDKKLNWNWTRSRMNWPNWKKK